MEALEHLEIQATEALKCSKESLWGHPHRNLSDQNAERNADNRGLV